MLKLLFLYSKLELVVSSIENLGSLKGNFIKQLISIENNNSVIYEFLPKCHPSKLEIGSYIIRPSQ